MVVAHLAGIQLAVGAVLGLALDPPTAGTAKAEPRWEVLATSARIENTYRQLHDRRKNRIVVVALSVRYQGPSGEVVRPVAAVVATGGQEVGEFRTASCRGSDDACLKSLEWLNGLGGHKARVLSRGQALTNGSLEYWFEVPRGVSELRIRFGDALTAPIAIEPTGR